MTASKAKRTVCAEGVDSLPLYFVFGTTNDVFRYADSPFGCNLCRDVVLPEKKNHLRRTTKTQTDLRAQKSSASKEQLGIPIEEGLFSLQQRPKLLYTEEAAVTV